MVDILLRTFLLKGMPVAFIFTGHALRRMFERSISVEQVKTAVRQGEIIARYLNDRPLPSRLLLFWSGQNAIHVVAAADEKYNREIIISVYTPDPTVWNKDMRTRR